MVYNYFATNPRQKEDFFNCRLGQPLRNLLFGLVAPGRQFKF
jgi:hypothetical protein